MLHIELMKHKMEFLDRVPSKKDKNKTRAKFRSETGYAFIDEYAHCHIIVYGEFLRDIYAKIFKCQIN